MIADITDTTIRNSWKWHAVAMLWDPTSIVAAFVVLLIGSPVSQAVPAMVPYLSAAILAYGFVLYLALVYTDGEVYPWFLFQKAQKPGRFQTFWYWKGYHRLRRFLKRTIPTFERDLFIRLRAARLASGENGSSESEFFPDWKLLLRALRQKRYEIRFLMDHRNRSAEMTRQAAQVQDSLREANTFMDGYLRYLLRVYGSFSDKARILMAKHEEVGMWKRLETYPNVARFVYTLVLVFIMLVLVRLAGIEIPWLP